MYTNQVPAPPPAPNPSWPKQARVATAVLAVLLVAAIVVGVFLTLQARSDADDYRAQVDEANEALDDTGDEAESLSERVDELVAEVDAAQGRVDELTAAVAAGDGRAVELQTQLDAANAQLSTALADLDAARTERDARGEAFGVGGGDVIFQADSFNYVGVTEICTGDFVLPAEACADRRIRVEIQRSGNNTFLNLPSIARITLGTQFGMARSGTAPGFQASCELEDGTTTTLETVVGAELTPISFTIEPATKVVVATSYTLRLQYYRPAQGICDVSDRVWVGAMLPA